MRSLRVTSLLKSVPLQRPSAVSWALLPDAVTAAEGEVGGTLQLGGQVVVAGAQGSGKGVRQVERNLSEQRQLLLRAGEVVEEDGERAARAIGGVDAVSGQRGVAELEAVAAVVAVVVVDVAANAGPPEAY